MHTRLMALMICLCLLCQPLCVMAAKEEPVPEPLTVSHAVHTDAGVTVTGQRAVVDFEYVRSISPECVGWLYMESIEYSQPLMQGADNKVYLHKLFDGSRAYNKGSVFLDAALDASMTQGHVILHGNGARDTRLYPLTSYSEQAFYDENPSFRLLAPAGDWQADVFACVTVHQRDTESWIAPESEAEYQTWLAGMLEKSRIQYRAECLPAAGERLLIVDISTTSTRRMILLCTLRPIAYDNTQDVDLIKRPLDRIETLNGVVQVGPLGEWIYYAQNDPIWDRMRFESERNSTFRVFSGGACGPTAAAIAVANLVPAEDLPKLAAYSANGRGTLMCTCSVNRVYCSAAHAPYLLSTPQEYLRYLPVALADFAAANNAWGLKFRRSGATGTNINFLDYVCDIYGISRTKVNLADSLQLLAEKQAQGVRGVVVCAALRKGPFTNASHFVVIVGVDEEYFYVLDPQRREKYLTDKRGVLEVLSPGVTRMRLSDYGVSDLSPVYYLEMGDGSIQPPEIK